MPNLFRTLALSLLLSSAAHAQLQTTGAPPAAQGWRAVTVAEGIVQPWGMAWLADGRMLVTGKEGTLHLVARRQALQAVPMEGLAGPVLTGGQGGLLDIAVHPADKGPIRAST
jgi:glucose/arabinose dehydrogenase